MRYFRKSKLELRIPPLAVFAIFVVALCLLGWLTPGYAFNGVFRAAGILALMATSAVFGIGSLAAFRRARTTVNPFEPECASSLVTGGVFRYSRNPMYLALLLLLLALGLFLSNLYALALALLFLPYMNRFQVIQEERAMEKCFGDEFTAYCRRVRRWL